MFLLSRYYLTEFTSGRMADFDLGGGWRQAVQFTDSVDSDSDTEVISDRLQDKWRPVTYVLLKQIDWLIDRLIDWLIV